MVRWIVFAVGLEVFFRFWFAGGCELDFRELDFADFDDAFFWVVFWDEVTVLCCVGAS